MAHFIAKKHKSTKKFFWAITTQTELFVTGYLRESFKHIFTNSVDIILLISKFSSALFIDTKILNFSEIDPMLSLLSNQFGNTNIHLTLLHRGSENKFDTKRLVTEILDELDEFIILFETNHGHVFGIYISEKERGWEFVIRSKTHYLPKVFAANKKRMIWVFDNDIGFTSENCCILFPDNDVANVLCVGRSGFRTNQLCGGNDSKLYLSHFSFQFEALEYEVFVKKNMNATPVIDDNAAYLEYISDDIKKVQTS